MFNIILANYPEAYVSQFLEIISNIGNLNDKYIHKNMLIGFLFVIFMFNTIHRSVRKVSHMVFFFLIYTVLFLFMVYFIDVFFIKIII